MSHRFLSWQDKKDSSLKLIKPRSFRNDSELGCCGLSLVILLPPDGADSTAIETPRLSGNEYPQEERTDPIRSLPEIVAMLPDAEGRGRFLPVVQALAFKGPKPTCVGAPVASLRNWCGWFGAEEHLSSSSG